MHYKTIYLDNAATTSVDLNVLAKIQPYFTQKYGNASEYHLLGRQARMGVETARKLIAQFLGAKPGEIIFTSCATESINLSHIGLLETLTNDFSNKEKLHVITSRIEHKAVLEVCKRLEVTGKVDVTYLPVDRYGLVSVKEVERAINSRTVLVSIMYVNNEVGTIQPIHQIGVLLKRLNKNRKNKIYFHTDATQAMGYLNCRVDSLGVDLLSFTGHKIHAPKGIGALYVRGGVQITPQTVGGGQERGYRSGTENVPYIVALGQAINNIAQIKKSKVGNLLYLRDYLIKNVLKIKGVFLTGHPKFRAPHIASFVVKGVEGETLVLLLSDVGIMVSTGSACASNGLLPLHVLMSMGFSQEDAHGSVRFSLSKKSTKSELDQVLARLPTVIEEIRKMTPQL